MALLHSSALTDREAGLRSLSLAPLHEGAGRRERQLYPAHEHECTAVPLSELVVDGGLRIYPEVTGKNHFQIHLRGDSLVFQAGGYVGLIPVNERVAIDVRPRIPLSNIEYILLVSQRPPTELGHYTRYYGEHDEAIPSLIDVYTRSLTRMVEAINTEGLHRDYQRQNAETSFPRGRIQMAGTVAKHRSRGESHRVSASWYEQSADTPPNQCLKYALWYLAQHYLVLKQKSAVRWQLREINAAYNVFRGVTLDRERRFLQSPLVIGPMCLPDIRWYYRDAIRLARAIIRDAGITFDGRRDDVLMASLLVNMEEVFEAYLRAVLAGEMGLIAPSVAVLDGNKSGAGGAKKLLYDHEPSPMATPDIVLNSMARREAEHSPPVVLEVKYKKVPKAPEREDISQTIAYGVSYRSKHVVLVHPRVQSSKQGLSTLGSIGGLEVSQYAYDLAAKSLAVEERTFAEAMLNLIG